MSQQLKLLIFHSKSETSFVGLAIIEGISTDSVSITVIKTHCQTIVTFVTNKLELPTVLRTMLLYQLGPP